MSWLVSRALMQDYENSHSLQGLVEAFSEAACSDGARSVLLSGSPMPHAFLPNDKTTAFSRLSRFGMTFGHLTDELGADVLTWCQAASRAKTSALPGKAQDWTESDPASGEKWRGWLAKYDPASSSWRTPQRSFIEGLDESSAILPSSGMTRGGLCWELPMLEPLTSATGYGLWPTPTVCGNYNRKGASATSGDGLATAVRMRPTPTSVSGNQVGRLDEWGGSRSREVMRTLFPPEELGGPLNPTWVEWLMHWPLNWTSLESMTNEQFDKWAQDGAAVVRGDRVRPVWFDAEPTQTPQGPKPIQQRSSECGGSLRDMSFAGTPQAEASCLQSLRNHVSAEEVTPCDGVQPSMFVGAGSDERAEALVPRVAIGVTARVDRLKAIGNGQVPLCAATAFRELSRSFD